MDQTTYFTVHFLNSITAELPN